MNLVEKHCEAGSPALEKAAAETLLGQVPGWGIEAAKKEISKTFAFDSYWEGLGFVNAVAWIAQAEKHHPDIVLLYKKAKVSFTTHDAGGLSENDFICAAKVNALIPEKP